MPETLPPPESGASHCEQGYGLSHGNPRGTALTATWRTIETGAIELDTDGATLAVIQCGRGMLNNRPHCRRVSYTMWRGCETIGSWTNHTRLYKGQIASHGADAAADMPVRWTLFCRQSEGPLGNPSRTVSRGRATNRLEDEVARPQAGVDIPFELVVSYGRARVSVYPYQYAIIAK